MGTTQTTALLNLARLGAHHRCAQSLHGACIFASACWLVMEPLLYVNHVEYPHKETKVLARALDSTAPWQGCSFNNHAALASLRQESVTRGCRNKVRSDRVESKTRPDSQPRRPD
jgi:hypothetical protein